MPRPVPEISVTQDWKDMVPVEVIAKSIQSIGEGVRALRAGPLNDKALFLLIREACPDGRGGLALTRPSLKDIKAVFEGIEKLEATFLKKKRAA